MDAQSQWTGLDAARLERIDEHMERAYIGPRKIAGAQIAIARRGQLAYRKSFGSMDIERGKPMAQDPLLRIRTMLADALAADARSDQPLSRTGHADAAATDRRNRHRLLRHRSDRGWHQSRHRRL